MSLITDLADKLATRVIAHVDATGDPDMERVITQTLGDSSQSLQEAFIVSLRAQRAAIRANDLLAQAEAAAQGAPAPVDPALAPAPEPEPPATESIPEAASNPEPEAPTDPEPEPQDAPKSTLLGVKKKSVGPWDLEG